MNIEIANRLVQLRKQHGYSQEELAAKLGLSRQAVSKWERAEASPDTDNLIMLSRVYGVSLDELLKTDEPIPEPEPDKGVKVTINGKPLRFNKDDGFYFSYGDDDDNGCADCSDAQIDADGHIVIEHGEKTFWQEFPFPIFVTILYLGLGFAFGLWHPGWILFLTIPAYYSIVGWFSGRRRHCFLRAFPYTILLVIAFLCMGCIWGLWHPGWILFLTIPMYYAMVKPIDRAYRCKHGISAIEIERDDDDIDDD
ncbi:MAG: hypothetical protein DBX62_04050 [Clostridia bacterium]|nr:MAG: hypothetical protein DBX62_04050 [Clostridia bacterium]